MTDDKRTALERAKARLRESVMDALDAAAYSKPGPWTNNALVTSMVLRLDDLIEAARAEGVKSCLSIRCMEHRDVRQINANEITGGECGACIAAQAREDCIEVLEKIRDSPLTPIEPGPEDLAIERIRELGPPVAEGRAAAANEHPTCATCGYYDQSSGMGTKWCERHLRYLPFAGTTTLPELLGCKEHTPRAEEGEG